MGQNGTVQSFERTHRPVQRLPLRLLRVAQGLMPPTLPEPELVTQFDRLKVFGESPTLQWLAAKYAKQ